jgi:hypothetical protein
VPIKAGRIAGVEGEGVHLRGVSDAVTAQLETAHRQEHSVGIADEPVRRPTESESAELFSRKRIGQSGRLRNAYALCGAGGGWLGASWHDGIADPEPPGPAGRRGGRCSERSSRLLFGAGFKYRPL